MQCRAPPRCGAAQSGRCPPGGGGGEGEGASAGAGSAREWGVGRAGRRVLPATQEGCSRAAGQRRLQVARRQLACRLCCPLLPQPGGPPRSSPPLTDLVASEMSLADSDSPSARITAALRSCREHGGGRGGGGGGVNFTARHGGSTGPCCCFLRVLRPPTAACPQPTHSMQQPAPPTCSAFMTTKRARSASCCATCLLSTAFVNSDPKLRCVMATSSTWQQGGQAPPVHMSWRLVSVQLQQAQGPRR